MFKVTEILREQAVQGTACTVTMLAVNNDDGSY